MAIEGQVEGGEAGVINEWLLSTYVLFVTFLTQFECDLLKGKAECHRAKNQLPRAVHIQPSSGSIARTLSHTC